MSPHDREPGQKDHTGDRPDSDFPGKYSEDKDLLRVLTCGSVDDGKSTLIGRLLHDSKLVYEDHLHKLESDSARVGSTAGEIDYSLLLDGLKAEREQGITIDVAYRYFSTPRRKFIIADCPGHIQYTRNMATGASTANLAILLVDAQKGLLDQTRRHSFICSLLDVAHLVVAVNKMDLVDYDPAVFDKIRTQFSQFATRLQTRHVHFVPISALCGDNVVECSEKMQWFRGAPLLDYLETVHVGIDRNMIDLRFPVQLVLRPDASFRGYAGTVASGILRKGADILALPSRKRSRIKRISTWDGELNEAFPPQAVTVELEDDIDVSRGDTLVPPLNVPRTSRSLETIVVWMAEKPLRNGASYQLKQTTTETRAEVRALRYKFDIETLHREPADKLALNEIGRIQLKLDQPLAYDPYRKNPATGSFILIDPIGNGTVGAGMILDRTTDGIPGVIEDDESAAIAIDGSHVTRGERRERFGHTSLVIRLDGAAAGHATQLERRLFDMGFHISLAATTPEAILLASAGLISIVVGPLEQVIEKTSEVEELIVSSGDLEDLLHIISQRLET